MAEILWSTIVVGCALAIYYIVKEVFLWHDLEDGEEAVESDVLGLMDGGSDRESNGATTSPAGRSPFGR